MCNNKKKLLILNRSFWPDNEATGQFLAHLSQELVLKYDITVIAGRSFYVQNSKARSFPYSIDFLGQIKIIRVYHTLLPKSVLLGRFTNWVIYGIFSFFAALSCNPDIIIGCTDPPFMGIIGLVISKLKKAKLIYYCCDLYPDVVWALGKLSRSSIFSLVFDFLNKIALRKADIVVVLGQSMKERVLYKGVSEQHICVISYWEDTQSIKPVVRHVNPMFNKFGLKDDEFILMYAGNLGLSQPFDPLLKAILLIQDKQKFTFLILGDGADKHKLVKKANLLGIKNIIFMPYQSQDMRSNILSLADLHIVLSKIGIAGAVVPSKIYGIMAVARAYLSITDKENEAAYFAEKFNCGLWVDVNDPLKIADRLLWAMQNPKALTDMGNNGRKLAETEFDKSIVLKKWFSVLEEVSCLKEKCP